MIRIHIPRFNEIDRFFQQYNLQLKKIEAGEDNAMSGPVAVIKIIYRYSLLHQNDMEGICEAIVSESSEAYIQSFFKDLRKEINNATFEL